MADVSNDVAEKSADNEQPAAPKPKLRPKKPVDLPALERRNWLIHQHFIQKDLMSCKHLIKEQMIETSGECEYAFYVQGLITRNEGNITESTEHFQACNRINPNNVEVLKQIGRNMFLVGKYRNAIECYKKAAEVSMLLDWEISHQIGYCYLHLNQYDKAEEHLLQALASNKHDVTFSTLGSMYLEQNMTDKAMDILKSGVTFSPENLDLLTTLGLLHLRRKNFHEAFELLGQAMTFDPENYKAILAAGSLMQFHGDFDVALTKYRVAAQKAPESAALWNNIAMCFFGKKKYVAAISCLKRATYLAPFDWKILYNLCLLHLTMQQYASAFQFGSSALRLKPKNANIYMLLAVALNHLGESENARKSYEEAYSLNPGNKYIILNYAAFLHQTKNNKEAMKLLKKLESLLREPHSDMKEDKEVEATAKSLAVALQMGDEFLKPLVLQNQNSEKKKSSKSQREKPLKEKTLEDTGATPDGISKSIHSPLSPPPSSIGRGGVLPPVGSGNLPLPSLPQGKLPNLDINKNKAVSRSKKLEPLG